MGQLHEVLAARASREEEARNAIRDTREVLGAPHLFEAFLQTYRHLEDDLAGQYREVPKEATMTTTVPQVLRQLREPVGKLIDLMYTVDKSNMDALAEIRLDGISLPAMPSTQLLSLEKKIKELKDAFSTIPVHDPKLQWRDDPQRENVVMTDPQLSFVTTKRVKYDVVVQPTKEHPAVVKERAEDPIVGERTKVFWSGKLAQKQKNLLLRRADDLIEAIHIALARANQVEAKDGKISKDIFDFLFNGIA
jgi:hypothetical protein